MKKILLAAAFLIGSAISAFAACTGPAVMHDFPGTSFNMSLATVPDGNCGSNVALPTWAGGTLGAMAAYGTSPGAVLVPGVNAFVTNTVAANATLSAETTKVIGTVNQGTSPWIGNMTQVASTALGTPTAYGTAPTGNAIGVNAFVTNTNNNGQAALASSSPVAIAKNSGTGSTVAGAAVGTAGSASAEVVTVQGVAAGTPLITGANPYPVGAVAYTASATGTTTATTATLAGAASVTTYICGFSIRANATAAATGNATVTGVITATLNFTQWTAPNASGLGITEMIFSPCVPASAANTSVAVVSAAPGTGGVVSVTAWGYKL